MSSAGLREVSRGGATIATGRQADGASHGGTPFDVAFAVRQRARSFDLLGQRFPRKGRFPPRCAQDDGAFFAGGYVVAKANEPVARRSTAITAGWSGLLVARIPPRRDRKPRGVWCNLSGGFLWLRFAAPPGQLVVRVRERASADAQEVTGEFACLPVTSCGFAALRHPDNKLSGPRVCGAFCDCGRERTAGARPSMRRLQKASLRSPSS